MGAKAPGRPTIIQVETTRSTDKRAFIHALSRASPSERAAHYTERSTRVNGFPGFFAGFFAGEKSDKTGAPERVNDAHRSGILETGFIGVFSRDVYGDTRLA